MLDGGGLRKPLGLRKLELKLRFRIAGRLGAGYRRELVRAATVLHLTCIAEKEKATVADERGTDARETCSFRGERAAKTGS